LNAQDPSFVDSFDIDQHIRVVALVGGGGKTSLMYRLAHEISLTGRSVITTTTTKIFPPQPHQSRILILLADETKLDSLSKHLSVHRHLTVGESILPNGKVQGVTSAIINECLDVADIVLVEADGAARKPVKAPEKWEPVLPEKVHLVIPVVGLDCVGKPANSDTVFRLEHFLKVTGLNPGRLITPDTIGRLLAHSEGSLKNVPDDALVVPYLNKLDTFTNGKGLQEIIETAFSLSAGRIKKAVAGQLRERLWVKVVQPT
jgi:probable selenium-dependent hydroxylase accessory protein YqeC